MSDTSRIEAQQRADEIRIFRKELGRLEGEGVLLLSDAQRASVSAHHDGLLARFAQSFDIDRDMRSKQMSWGMRIASFLGALALAASVFFLFYQFWGRFTEAAQDISFDAMAGLQRQVAEIVRGNPNVHGVMSFIGAGGNNPSLNRGRLFITLKPHAERVSADEVVRQLRPRLSQLVGVKAFIQNIPTIRIGQLTKSPYQYVLRGASTGELYHWVPIIEGRLKSIPKLVDVSSDLQIHQPQVRVDIDRAKASALGVSAQQLEVALGAAYGSSTDRCASLICRKSGSRSSRPSIRTIQARVPTLPTPTTLKAASTNR